MIAARYLLRETLATAGAVTLVLLIVTVGARLGGYVDDALAGKVAPSALAGVIALRLPEFLVLLAPLAAYVAVLIAHGRLHARSERVVLAAAGWGPGRFAMQAAVFGTWLAVPVSGVSLAVAPEAAAALERLLARERATAVFRTAEPGRFMELDHGRRALWIGGVAREAGALEQVLLIELGAYGPGRDAAGPLVVVRAGRGRVRAGAGAGAWLDLEAGARYAAAVSPAGEPLGTEISFFERLAQRLESARAPREIAAVGTLALRARAVPEARAELHWRLALPLLVPLLALAAAPLSVGGVRGGPRLMAAGLLLVVVLVGMVALRAQAGLGVGVPPWAVWWPHLVVGIVALRLVIRAARPAETPP